MKGPRLTIVPCSRAQAQAYVNELHRHHRASVTGVFQLAVVDESGLVRGVAMVGRPVARPLCDGLTLEVNRVATDGCPNACSALYGAAWRAAKSLGYRRMVTYTLPSEGGGSLRASGWTEDGTTKGRPWGQRQDGRKRLNEFPLVDKTRWVVHAQGRSGFIGSPSWPEFDGTGTLDLFPMVRASET